MRARLFLSLVALGTLLSIPGPVHAAPPVQRLVGAVDFVDAQVGWVEVSTSAAYAAPVCGGAAANTGRCREATITVDATRDGGLHWHTVLRTRATVPLQGAEGLPATAIHLFNHAQGYVALNDTGGHPIQLRTVDGGAHWVRRPLPRGQVLVGNDTLTFSTPEDGYFLIHVDGAMQHEAVDVYATHDAGAHWRRVESASFDPHRGTPYAVGLPGDKGAIFFLNRPSGWITASDPTGIPYLYATEDQGVTWARQAPPVPAGVPTQAGGRAIYGYGTLERPTFFSSVSGLLAETLELCPRQPSSQSCTFSLYAFHLVDNGRHWARPQLLRRSPDERFRPRWQFLNLNRWFVSFGNTLWSTADAGRHWRVVHAGLPQSQVLQELSFLSPDGGFAIGAGAVQNAQGYPKGASLFRTIDAGAHWQRVSLLG